MGQNFEDKISKKYNICNVIISLIFWNNKILEKIFIVRTIDLHKWNSKIRSKNWEKWSFVFFSLKTNFVI